MKHGKVNLTETEESVSLSKRNTLKWLGQGVSCCQAGYRLFLPPQHRRRVITARGCGKFRTLVNIRRGYHTGAERGHFSVTESDR